MGLLFKKGGYDDDLKPNKIKLISYCPDTIHKLKYTSYIFAMPNMKIYNDTTIGEVSLSNDWEKNTKYIKRPIYFVLLFRSKKELVKTRLMLDITNIVEI